MWYGLSDFNTSYVVVQPSGGKAMYAEDIYFNTSYVVVQLHAHVLLKFFDYFNISYLVVQLYANKS